MLSPVPPFSRRDQEIRIAGLLTPLLVGSWFLTANVIFRLATLFIGIGIFGDPMITRGLEFLDRVQPDWKQIYHINK